MAIMAIMAIYGYDVMTPVITQHVDTSTRRHVRRLLGAEVKASGCVQPIVDRLPMNGRFRA